jgi:hypothetical protein
LKQEREEKEEKERQLQEKEQQLLEMEQEREEKEQQLKQEREEKEQQLKQEREEKEEKERQLQEKEQQLKQEREEKEEMEKIMVTLSDPRMDFWKLEMPGSESSQSGSRKKNARSSQANTKSIDDVKKEIRDDLRKKYGSYCCLFCGSTTNVTLAHLVASNTQINYREFGTGTYRDNLDPTSLRNFIPLCGTLGETGTCHHEFDTHQVSLFYNPFERKYSLCKFADLSFKVVTVKHKPYHRLMAWRTRFAIRSNFAVLKDDVFKSLVTSSQLSASSKQS